MEEPSTSAPKQSSSSSDEQKNKILKPRTLPQEILCDICDLWKIKGDTNNTTPKNIFNTMFTAKGCQFLTGSTESKDKALAALEVMYSEAVGEKSLEQKLIEEEVQKLQVERTKKTNLGDNLPNYKKSLQTSNADFLRDKKVTLDKTIEDFCTNFHISFKMPTTVNVVNIKIQPSTSKPSTPTDSSDSNRVFTLFDPLLQYHKFTKNGTETEWTHQFPLNCIIANACLDINNLTFRTNEAFKRANACLDSALNSCQIPTLSEKRDLKGDCHVLVSIPLTDDSKLNHVCLVLEHQRESCSSVWTHKDFAKMLLLMRTCLKTSVQTSKRSTSFLGNLRTFGILSSKDNIFLLCMETNFLPVRNLEDLFGVQFDLSYEHFSSNNNYQREQFIKQLTAHLTCFKQIKPVKKSFNLLTTPRLSNSLMGNTTPQPSLLNFASFLNQKVCDAKQDLDGIFKEKGYRFIEQIVLTQDNFSKATSGNELMTCEQLEANTILTQNRIMIILRLDYGIVIGRVYEKTNPSISLQGSDHENDEPSDKNDKTNDNAGDKNEGSDDEISEIDDESGDENYEPNDEDEPSDNDQSDDYEQHSNSNQKRNRKVHESTTKKRKVPLAVNQVVNYSDNLKEITSKFDINGKKATKVQNNEKVALYFTLPRSFLKIVHYFDNSSENSKGMNIVRELEHDNINKILHFERMFLSDSQLNELFFENIASNAKTCVFITLVQLVSDFEIFYFYLKKQDMNHRLLRFIKIMLDGIEAVNTLHENNLIHGDISIRNVGILFSESSKTAFMKEKSQIVKLLEHLTDVADFNFILLDMNHCKVEGQITSNTFKESNQDIAENVFYPFTSDPYCPTKPSIQFTKEHDYYSMAMVLAQLLLSLVFDVTFEELEKWEKENLKEIILEELEKRRRVCKNADIMIKLLKDTIENEGKGYLFNFKTTFELLNEHLVQPIRDNLERKKQIDYDSMCL